VNVLKKYLYTFWIVLSENKFDNIY